MKLPEVTFFEDFYFWFNTETKKEYYATPLYFYKADFHLDYDNKVRNVYYKKTEITDNGLKHPASLYFPFHERLGLLLLRFLNADLSEFEKANKTFFYAYGFEVLRDLDKNYKFELKQNYNSYLNLLIFRIHKHRRMFYLLFQSLINQHLEILIITDLADRKSVV